MSSVYASGVQKHKKDSHVVSLFTLSGSARTKAAHKHVGEIDPRWCYYFKFSIYHIQLILKQHRFINWQNYGNYINMFRSQNCNYLERAVEWLLYQTG